MKINLLLLFTTLSFLLNAQSTTCDGSRYIDIQFVPDTTEGILYGNADTYGGANQDLYLDFFEPKNDVATERPLIILAFGGSFIGGSRDNMHSLCAYYSSKGYTAATIDYRLYDGPLFPIPDSVTMTDVVIKAVGDMKAAVRFFKEDAANANQYKVDTTKIFVGGISAGGIVANHVGLLQSTNTVQPYIQTIINDNGGWSGNSSTNTQHLDNDVAGVINYSGALKWASYVDANDPPIFSVHDDQDGTVPYGTGSASVFSFPVITMQGSYEIDLAADAAGSYSELITIPNSTGHVSYFDNQVGTDSILQRSSEFLLPLVCGADVGIHDIAEIESVSMYPNPASDVVYLEFEDSNQRNIRVIDLSGRVVMNASSNNTFEQVQLKDLPRGNYIVEVSGVDGKLPFRKQVIKL